MRDLREGVLDSVLQSLEVTLELNCVGPLSPLTRSIYNSQTPGNKEQNVVVGAEGRGGGLLSIVYKILVMRGEYVLESRRTALCL